MTTMRMPQMARFPDQPHRTTLGRMNPALAPTIRPVASDLYWAGGIWEGEGSSQRAGLKKHVGTELVSVSQKDPWILERLRALFGGSVARQKRPNQGVLYRWIITGARARGFLMSIYGIVSPRRQEEIRKVMQWTPS